MPVVLQLFFMMSIFILVPFIGLFRTLLVMLIGGVVWFFLVSRQK